MKHVVKEIFIIALLIMTVVFIIGMIFYEYMPNNKIVPEPITYMAESSTTAVLQGIQSEVLIQEDSEEQSIIKSYSIGAKELSTAAAKHSYTSGKTNPFSQYVVKPDSNTANGTNNTNTTSTTTSSVSTGGASTGTFFESSNSK